MSTNLRPSPMPTQVTTTRHVYIPTLHTCTHREFLIQAVQIYSILWLLHNLVLGHKAPISMMSFEFSLPLYQKLDLKNSLHHFYLFLPPPYSVIPMSWVAKFGIPGRNLYMPFFPLQFLPCVGNVTQTPGGKQAIHNSLSSNSLLQFCLFPQHMDNYVSLSIPFFHYIFVHHNGTYPPGTP